MKKLHVGDLMGGILFDIQKERERQEILLIQGKFPWSCANLEVGDRAKLSVLAEEFGEAAKEAAQIGEIRDQYTIVYGKDCPAGFPPDVQNSINAKKKLLREELIQIAAVCVAWCEALDVQLDNREDIKDLYPKSQVICTCKPFTSSYALPGEMVLAPGCPMHDKLSDNAERAAQRSLDRIAKIKNETSKQVDKRNDFAQCTCVPCKGYGARPGEMVLAVNCPVHISEEMNVARFVSSNAETPSHDLVNLLGKQVDKSCIAATARDGGFVSPATLHHVTQCRCAK